MRFIDDLILRLMKSNPHRVFKINEVTKELGLSYNQRKEVKKTLRELAKAGAIQELRNNHFSLLKETRNFTGRIEISEKGSGFVKPRNNNTIEGDVFIHGKNLKDAVAGDLVEVKIKCFQEDGKRLAEGVVERVLERGRVLIVGRFYREPYGAHIEPRDKKFKRKIVVRKKFKRDEIRDDTWVVVRIVNFTPFPEPLIGQIEEILGEDGDRGLDVMILIRDFGVTPEFSEEIKHYAESLEKIIPEREIKKRLDLRNKHIFTIDPVHAKDFDDALSVEILPNGKHRVGVHIADVAYFVKDGSILDADAFNRGTSIYPVDRVVPMLPEVLSNDLCSLNPNVDRLTVSALIDLDEDANVVNVKFFNSIINSIYRMNYYEVQRVFDKDEGSLRKYAKIVDDLLLLKEITRKLREKRLVRGALDLDVPEVEVVVDKRGVAIDIRPYERLESHKLVEECMLLANELVARHLIKLKIPTIFRIHEIADPRKLEALAPALQIFGLSLPSKDSLTTRALQNALEQTKNRENGGIARRLILRSLKRAKYSSENRGHFGLASPHYLHFTSPIRRYPDLVVHRILKEWMESKNIPEKRIDELTAILPDIAEQCSEREDRADEIERDTTTMKCLEFMRKLIGDVFEGFISGISTRHFFVELKDYPVEGKVYLKSIPWDCFKIDDTGYRLIGKKTKKSFKMGQKVTVQIVKIDLINVEMELRLLD